MALRKIPTLLKIRLLLDMCSVLSFKLKFSRKLILTTRATLRIVIIMALNLPFSAILLRPSARV